MSESIYIGDAVIPRDEPDHDVMTVYDFASGRSIACCNWVVGTRMFKRNIPVSKLVKMERAKR